MKISEAKATQAKGAAGSVYEVINDNLAKIHKTAATNCPGLWQRVAALQASFLMANEEDDMTAIVQTWQEHNPDSFKQDLIDDYFAFGLDNSAEGRVFHQLSQVVKHMLDPMAWQVEKEARPTVNKPTTSPSLPPSGDGFSWSRGLASLGQRLTGALVQQSVNTLSSAVLPPKTGLKESLLNAQDRSLMES